MTSVRSHCTTLILAKEIGEKLDVFNRISLAESLPGSTSAIRHSKYPILGLNQNNNL